MDYYKERLDLRCRAIRTLHGSWREILKKSMPEAAKCQSVKIPELKAIKPVFLLNSCQNMSLLERDNGT